MLRDKIVAQLDELTQRTALVADTKVDADPRGNGRRIVPSGGRGIQAVACAAEEPLDSGELRLTTAFQPRDSALIDVDSLGELTLRKTTTLSCGTHEDWCATHPITSENVS